MRPPEPAAPDTSSTTPSRADAPALRARFAAEGLARTWRGALTFAAFSAAMLVVSAMGSGFAEPAIFLDLLRTRAAALVAIAAVAGLLATELGARRPRELMLVLVAVMSVCMLALAQDTGGQRSEQYDRLTLLVLGLCVLMSWSPAWVALGCAVVLAVYLGGAGVFGQLAAAELPGHLGRLLAASAVAIGASVLRERQRWRELCKVHGLTVARERAEADLRRLNEELEQRVLERTAALRASEARFRAMVESAPVGVITVDPAGAVVHANRSFASMLARAPEGLPGALLVDLAAADDRAGLGEALAALQAGGGDVQRSDVRFQRGADTIATHGALAAIRDEAGRFLCAIGMVEDVTERRRAEDLAREQQAQLAQALRMTTLAGMVAELAHELNQPLGAIVNFANGTATRLRRDGADPALADAVASIASEGMRAADMIRRLREFVRPGGAATECVDLNALVRHSTALIERDAGRDRIPIDLRLDPALPALTLDRGQVEQVLLNLLHNALDAMRAAPRPDHALRIETRAHADAEVEVRVCDTGVGVSGDAAGRMFEAFFTTKPGGLGMGLPISRSIVEAHGGRLWAVGNPEGGMTFAFTLPGAAVTPAARGHGAADG